MNVKRLYPIILAVSTLSLFTSCFSPKQPNSGFTTTFEQCAPGKLTDRETKKIWRGAKLLCGKKDFVSYKLGITPHPFSIDEENGNHFLKILIPKHKFGPITGAQWSIPIVPADEYFFSYRVKFEDGFDFAKGGKLPGLAGGAANSGGHIPNGTDGWSARMMFWESGKLSFYIYFPEQSSQWGERLYLKNEMGDTIRIRPGRWHTITQHLVMNTPGMKNGIMEAWFDGQASFFSDTILFRKNENLKIDQVFQCVFLGGDDLSWASTKDEYICLDDFRISTELFSR